jgi:hypothetical protein
VGEGREEKATFKLIILDLLMCDLKIAGTLEIQILRPEGYPLT